MIIEFLIIFIFFVIAFGFMGLSLHFSKYKKKSGGCCGGSSIEGHESHNEGYSCATCPDRDKH